MKKYFIILIILLSLFLNNCAVNNFTGLLKIYNLTDSTVTNLKIGNKLITYSLTKGEVYNYWYSTPFEGKIQAEGIDKVLAKFLAEDEENGISYSIYKDNPDCIFNLDFEYHLDIINSNNESVLYVNPGFQPADQTIFDFPAN